MLSITESDQPFSLCCGLLLFAYESGPEALGLIRFGPPAATLWLVKELRDNWNNFVVCGGLLKDLGKWLVTQMKRPFRR